MRSCSASKAYSYTEPRSGERSYMDPARQAGPTVLGGCRSNDRPIDVRAAIEMVIDVL
jgi:hypothetical protein